MALDKKYLVPASSLVSPEHQGYLTKLGEKVKNWKRRYFILRAGVVYYYKKNDAPKPQGVVILKKGVKFDHKKSPYTFAIQTDVRTYYMYGDAPSDMEGWLTAIRTALDSLDAAPSISIKPIGEPKGPMVPTATQAGPVVVPAAVAPVNPTVAVASGSNKGLRVMDFDFMKIPPHILLHILSYLDVNSLRAADQTGKCLHTAARSANFVATCLARQRAAISGTEPSTDPRVKFQACKQSVKWLVTSPQVSEFWDIFTAQVPKPGAPAETTTGTISFSVTSSLDQQKTTWRAEGPQHLFITPMVDFFVRVGAPDAEIDKLNHFGALITPPQIGFWIDVSQAGGLDGGWYFPFPQMPLDTILDALEPGACNHDIKAWVKKHWHGKPATCFFFGRDMGMEPPRQTELRIELPPVSLHSQWKIIMDAYERFQFPKPAQAIQDVLKSSLAHSLANGRIRPLALSLTVSSDDHFVKIAILQEAPPVHLLPIVFSLQNLTNAQYTEFVAIQGALQKQPQCLEFQFLHETYGYRVYPHGFSIGASYAVGSEPTYL